MDSRVALAAIFLVFWVLAEAPRRDEGWHPQTHRDSLDLAASDFVKCILSLIIWSVSRYLQLGARPMSTVTDIRPPTCAVLFQDYRRGFLATEGFPVCRESNPRPSIIALTLGDARSTLSILAAGLLYTLRTYIVFRTREFFDLTTLSLAFPVIILGILIILRIARWRNFPSTYWYASLIQFAGLFIARDSRVGSTFSFGSFLAAFVLCNCIWDSFLDLIYGFHHHPSSVHIINTVVFAQSCLVHFLWFLLPLSESLPHSHDARFLLSSPASFLFEAAKDILAMMVIQQYGAIRHGILVSLASTFLMAIDTWKSTEVSDYSASLGCLVAILGCGIFIFCGDHVDEQPEPMVSAWRSFASTMICLVVLGYIIIVVSLRDPVAHSELTSKWTRPPERHPNCRTSESSALIQTQTIASYDYFSNVLLIVFFSHARYDANLDFHREVYGDYFPNIVYVGPATREDKGFAHSYDVLVDSFQSGEDLSDPLFYRMSGRMAHHMLYTALREYECFDGYLWVPFDTFLNVPRLQQFNQSLFWYHSPWGQPVPNTALGNFTEPVLNVSQHAPPARVSPDTSVNLTETWRGWGPDWCDPHVGVSVCMNAFRKVPEHMRAHMAELTDGETRLIGGSADTLYIPGRHRKVFMDVLALFLETNCFLEIATPTTVHLVVPPGESIQFVDHWWIWEPPFNASFVRQKWDEGFEVDTFHTFHWGEHDENGIWRGDHRHVADVRQLQRESAERQGFGDTFPVNSQNLYVDV